MCEGRIIDQAFQSCGDGFRRISDEQAGLPVDHGFTDAAFGHCDRWQAARSGLDRRQAEWLQPRRIDEGAGSVEKLDDFGVVDAQMGNESYAAFDGQGPHLFDRVVVFGVTDPGEGRERRWRRPDCAYCQRQVLLLVVCAEPDDETLTRTAEINEALRIDTQVPDLGIQSVAAQDGLAAEMGNDQNAIEAGGVADLFGCLETRMGELAPIERKGAQARRDRIRGRFQKRRQPLEARQRLVEEPVWHLKIDHFRQ